MNAPNPELMERYNTRQTFEEKKAGVLPLAARIAMGVLGAGAAHSSMEEQRLRTEEAELMNERFRMLLDVDMAPARESLQHTRVPMYIPAGSPVPLGMTDGMVRLASTAGQDMAQLEKEAGIGMMMGGLSGALKAIPALGRGFSQGLGAVRLGPGAVSNSAIGSFGKSLKWGVQKGGIEARKTFQSGLAAGQTRDLVRAAAKTPPAPKTPTSMGNLIAPQKPQKVPQMQPTAREVESSSTSVRRGTAQAAAPAQPAAQPQPQQPAQEVRPPNPAPQAQPAAPQAPGRLQTELGNGAWKWKLPALGAMALGGAGLYGAAKGTFNWLGREPAPYTHNEGGATPARGVNQYGVPDRSPMY